MYHTDIHTVHTLCVLIMYRLDELRLSRQWLTDDSFTVTKQVYKVRM
jgi:hypothetical protein